MGVGPDSPPGLDPLLLLHLEGRQMDWKGKEAAAFWTDRVEEERVRERDREKKGGKRRG